MFVCTVAWYDYDLKGYQEDRQNNELDRVLEERVDSKHSILHESKFGDYMAKPVTKEPQEMDWQRIAREKASSGDKIKEVSLLSSLLIDLFFLINAWFANKFYILN